LQANTKSRFHKAQIVTRLGRLFGVERTAQHPLTVSGLDPRCWQEHPETMSVFME
jgi:hypothetical protein